MSQNSVGLTVNTVAALRICSEYADVLARRICGFLGVKPNRERFNYLAPIARENVDELLVAIPVASNANLSNTAYVPVQYLPPKLLSPFGDW